MLFEIVGNQSTLSANQFKSQSINFGQNDKSDGGGGRGSETIIDAVRTGGVVVMVLER